MFSAPKIMKVSIKFKDGSDDSINLNDAEMESIHTIKQIEFTSQLDIQKY